MMGYGNTWSQMGLGAGLFGTWMGGLLLPVIIWSLAWKGWALWKAAKDDSKVWFVVLMLVNTLGILEILYIFLFSPKKEVLSTLGPAKARKKSRK